MSGEYQREPERRWRSAVEPIYQIKDGRERAIALLELAIGEGFEFLSLADTELHGWTPDADREGWADFFEHAEAGTARKSVHGTANSAFLALTLEQKLHALKALDGQTADTEEYNG